MLANPRNHQNSYQQNASLLPNETDPQYCTPGQNDSDWKSWESLHLNICQLLLLPFKSKDLVQSVLCIHEESFNTLGSGLGFTLVTLTLVSEVVMDQLVLETISNIWRTRRWSAWICKGEIMLNQPHHFLQWDNQLGWFGKSSECCLPWF